MAAAAYHITPLTPLPVWLLKLLMMTCHINILEVSFHYTAMYVALLESLSGCSPGTCIGKLEVGEVWIAILSAC